MINQIFIAHPRQLGESYRQHQRAAFFYAAKLMGAALAAALHGIFPCLCQSTASRTVADLYRHMQERHLPPP